VLCVVLTNKNKKDSTMALSIGLEALRVHPTFRKQTSFDVVYADFLESSIALDEQIQHYTNLCVAFENLLAIRKTVKRYGYTNSLKSLIGTELGSSSVAVSNEAEGAIRKVWEQIVDWFKKILRYVEDFFAKLFKTRRGLMLLVQKINDKPDDYKTDKFKGLPVKTLDRRKLADSEGLDADSIVDINLDYASQIANYARAVLNAMKAADKAEIELKSSLNAGLAIAKRGINDPESDVSNARAIQTENREKLKNAKAYCDLVFRSARNFVKATKKRQE
jgi:hypothetical protein